MGNCCSEPVDFDGDVTLFHFDLHRVVGKGAFGKVRVVEHKLTHTMYALKYIDKAKCIKQRAVANIIQERRLLEEIDHPFVVNMRYAFQDDENCFFVLDLMLGGDLRFHVERKPTISEEHVKFWVAEVASALEYLHRKRIVHRDLKPDNILLDEKGHAHVTDFNVAIHYSERRLHTSVAGSMAYMAPEVLGKKGYTWCVDFWSLGVVMWEMLLRRRPFEGRTQEALTKSVCKDPIKFPERAQETISVDGQSFIMGLLERTPSRRLGCRPDGQGYADIKAHPWYKDMDWEKLLNKELPSPFEIHENQAYFDISHELDEFLMVDKPLTAHKRKANVDLDKMKPELRQLEEYFTNYDFKKSRRVSYYPHNQPLVAPKRDPDAARSSTDDQDGAGAGTVLLQSHTHTNTLIHTNAGDPSRPGTPSRSSSVDAPPPLPSASLMPTSGPWPNSRAPSRASIGERPSTSVRHDAGDRHGS